MCRRENDNLRVVYNRDHNKFPKNEEQIKNCYDEPIAVIRTRETSRENVEYIEGYKKSGTYGKAMTKKIYVKRSALEVAFRVSLIAALVAVSIAAWAVCLAI